MDKAEAPRHAAIDRGLALHKMIRLLTYALGGEGWLNFMGNEFGHPEWVDFPRAGNDWSYHYCRRQWGLCDAPALLYGGLAAFDAAMHALEDRFPWLEARGEFVSTKNNADKVLAFDRETPAGPLLFVFNFNSSASFTDYRLGVPRAGGWRLVLDSDARAFDGYARVDAAVPLVATACEHHGRDFSVLAYLPARTVLVFAQA